VKAKACVISSPDGALSRDADKPDNAFDVNTNDDVMAYGANNCSPGGSPRRDAAKPHDQLVRVVDHHKGAPASTILQIASPRRDANGGIFVTYSDDDVVDDLYIDEKIAQLLLQARAEEEKAIGKLNEAQLQLNEAQLQLNEANARVLSSSAETEAHRAEADAQRAEADEQRAAADAQRAEADAQRAAADAYRAEADAQRAAGSGRRIPGRGGNAEGATGGTAGAPARSQRAASGIVACAGPSGDTNSSPCPNR
jgi:hypothetical protein